MNIPKLLLIGAAKSNSGKTELAVKIIEKYKDLSIIGLKVTTIHEEAYHCPRGESGCGVCLSVKESFTLVEECSIGNDKDTQRLLQAGAKKVYWLCAKASFLFEGFKAFLSLVKSELIVCESNSLRNHIIPGLFLMVQSKDDREYKPSAEEVKSNADYVIYSDKSGVDFSIDRIGVCNKSWLFIDDTEAVILAGGTSSRMGRDKCFLDIHNRSLIDIKTEVLKNIFGSILISIADESQVALYEKVNGQVVYDRLPGCGPLSGIESALSHIKSNYLFVTACDMPDFDEEIFYSLFYYCKDYDAVVPKNLNGRVEPLFGVYQKSCLEKLRRFLRSGNYSATDFLRSINTKYVLIEKNIINLNTPENLERYIHSYMGIRQ